LLDKQGAGTGVFKKFTPFISKESQMLKILGTRTR
jgi:hypothetical protein